DGQPHTYYVYAVDGSNPSVVVAFGDSPRTLSVISSSCTDTTWTPSTVTNLCGTITQTSNCGRTRTVSGGLTCTSGQTCNAGICQTLAPQSVPEATFDSSADTMLYQTNFDSYTLADLRPPCGARPTDHIIDHAIPYCVPGVSTWSYD